VIFIVLIGACSGHHWKGKQNEILKEKLRETSTVSYFLCLKDVKSLS